VLNLEQIKSFLDLERVECQNLLKHFEKYNKISMEAIHYETEAGFKERADWCIILNKA
jgi:hypothetical protein